MMKMKTLEEIIAEVLRLYNFDTYSGQFINEIDGSRVNKTDIANNIAAKIREWQTKGGQL